MEKSLKKPYQLASHYLASQEPFIMTRNSQMWFSLGWSIRLKIGADNTCNGTINGRWTMEQQNGSKKSSEFVSNHNRY